MPGLSVDPPPAVNWDLVDDDDQQWQRKEGSKSAPPMLNVSGFSADLLFGAPTFDSNHPTEGRSEAGFQDFITSVSNLANSPEVTPNHSQNTSFSSTPLTESAFTKMLLGSSRAQQVVWALQSYGHPCALPATVDTSKIVNTVQPQPI